MPVASYDSDDRLSKHIKDVREDVLKLSQSALATRLGVSQSNVSRWEKDLLRPEIEHLVKLANLLQGRIEGVYFLEAAGIPVSYLMSKPQISDDGGKTHHSPAEGWISIGEGAPPGYLSVPLLRDRTAVSDPAAVAKKDIEVLLYLPKIWVSPGASLVAIRAAGDAMAPMISDGDVVFINLNQRDAKKLHGRVVAARNDDGLVVRWCHQSGKHCMMVPENPSKFAVSVASESEGWKIIGAVVHWMGFPGKRK